MSNLVMWSAIVGFLLPNIVAVVQQPKWSEPLRAGLTAVACLIAGFGTAYFNGQFSVGDVVGSVLVTGVSAISFYKGFWKPTGVASAIENATSSTPPRAEALHPDDGPNMRRDRNQLGAIDPVQALVIAILAIGLILLLLALVDRV